MSEEREAAGKLSHCENYLTDTLGQTAQHPFRCLSPPAPLPSLPPRPSSPFSPPCFLCPPCPISPSLPLPDCWVIQMVLLRTVNGVRPGWQGRRGRGGCRGGPDNNVTIRPAPRTSRAVEESESKQWSVAEGVSGSGEGRGERAVQGESCVSGGVSLPGS